MTEQSAATATALRAAITGASAENRVRAFLHHWLALLERPAATAEPLRELLADDLEMTLSDGRVLRTFEEVEAWYAGARELVDVSIHRTLDLTIAPVPGDRYELAMDFQWQGIARNGQAMVAHTRHRWTLVETGEPHLRLSRFAVTQLQPFTPVSAEEALARFEEARKQAA